MGIKRWLQAAIAAGIALLISTVTVMAQSPLFVAYPPSEHQTVADQIFFIGTGDPDQPVLINGNPIDIRSPDGHFAPSLPLRLGENVFEISQGDQQLTFDITRVSAEPPPPEGVNFGEGSLRPSADIVRQPGDLICFSAIAPPQAQVSVSLGDTTIPLMAEDNAALLPPNYAVLTERNHPIPVTRAQPYRGCRRFERPGNLGRPQFRLSQQGQTVTADGPGTVEIATHPPFPVAEVTVPAGVARTGPGTNHSRITPLPQGTRAAVTGQEGDWLRLDYGGWIRASETRQFTAGAPPTSAIRSVRSRQRNGWTEVLFPLQTPVPVTVDQTDRTLTLTLFNTSPETDTIFFNDDPVVERLDWRPLSDRAEYSFRFKGQQWGYKLAYEDTTLVLSLRHPPSLVGTTVLIDPGHGSDEDLGARGPTGYPEKDVALTVSLMLRDELQARGAAVVMTREGDDDLWPHERVDQINATAPTLALSVHYNALPDNGDALNTAGIGTFWYHAQAHDLAVFLHNYLVEELDRPSYGVFWNNLALTRPSIAPSVLLELGFMINPFEFEWIMDEPAQRQLVRTLAEGVMAWIARQDA